MEAPGSAPPPAGSPAAGVLTLLGLACKAGRLALGATAAEKLVRQGARPVVVLARDAGGGQRRRVLRWQPVRGFVLELLSRQDLAQRLGRHDLAVVAVADNGIVQGLVGLGVVAGSAARTAASRSCDDDRR